MNDLLLAVAPLVPATVPLLLAVVVSGVSRYVGGLRGNYALGWLLLAGLLGACVPLLPLPGLPRESAVWSWASIGGLVVPMGLSLDSTSAPGRGAMSLLLLGSGALGIWSITRLRRAGAGVLAGILLVVSGGQIVVQSVTPLGAVLGAGLAGLGTLLVELASAPDTPEIRLPGMVLLVLALLTLATAALTDPALADAAHLWAAGCGLLLFSGPLRMALGRSPLLPHGAAQAIGLSPIGAWLLVQFVRSGPGIPGGADLALAAGAIAFGFGASNAAASRTLRALLSAQWIAQLGLLLLALDAPAAAGAALFGTIANMVVSTLVLSLMLGRLAEIAGTERIAELSPLPVPMRRRALAYALAASSAAGLPLTLGYTLRRELVLAASSPFVEPLLLAGSTLLLLGLLPPLAAFVRRPAWRSPIEGQIDGRAGAGLLLGLLLVFVAPYQALLPVLAQVTQSGLGFAAGTIFSEHLPTLGRAAVQIVGAFAILLFGNRALRRMAARRVWSGGVPLDEEPGWALPFVALAQVVAPLTPGPWLAAMRWVSSRLDRWGMGILLSVRAAARRYYLPLLVAAAAVLILLAAVGIGS